MREINKKIQIGDKFIPRQKGKKKEKNIYTIKDIYITRNSKNEIIDVKYYSETDCIGQVLSWIVPTTTILMGKLIKNNKGKL